MYIVRCVRNEVDSSLLRAVRVFKLGERKNEQKINHTNVGTNMLADTPVREILQRAALAEMAHERACVGITWGFAAIHLAFHAHAHEPTYAHITSRSRHVHKHVCA